MSFRARPVHTVIQSEAKNLTYVAFAEPVSEILRLAGSPLNDIMAKDPSSFLLWMTVLL